MNKIVQYYLKYKNNICKLEQGGVKLSSLRCAFDGVFDYLVFGSTITDYFELSFWNKTFRQKAQYATWRLHKRFIYEVDDNSTILRLSDKHNMYKSLQEFVRREQLYSKEASFEDFVAFCDRHDFFFTKPCGNSCGEGIEKISTKTEDLKKLYQRLNQEEIVLDSPIIQHHIMSELNQSSVNTLRIFTFRNKNCIYFTGCALRIGTTGFIDNYSAGGLVCSVSLRTGKTKEKAENCLGERFIEHPVSHEKLEGYQVPRWDEVLRYVFEMAQMYDLNYVAWDIAVEEEGVDLVEANPAGMINVIQIAGGGPKKEIILKLENEWKKESEKQADSFKMIICE